MRALVISSSGLTSLIPQPPPRRKSVGAAPCGRPERAQGPICVSVQAPLLEAEGDQALATMSGGPPPVRAWPIK